jgi:hypothetical protein
MHHLLTILPSWLWHPLGQCAGAHAEYIRCRSYNFWSGIGSDLGELTLITGLLLALWRTHKHLECHVEAPKNCHRWGHLVPGTGHRACRAHHPHATEGGNGNITADVILKHHEDSGA